MHSFLIIRQRHRVLAIVVTSAWLVLGGCGEARPAPSSDPVTVNMDEIFPPGQGRDLLLNNCTSCHTFVPIVILQMTPEEWERNSRDHRERVTALSDDEFKSLYEYLVANFNPDRPVPELPKALLDTWTSY